MKKDRPCPAIVVAVTCGCLASYAQAVNREALNSVATSRVQAEVSEICPRHNPFGNQSSGQQALSFGNLKRLNLQINKDQYLLNGAALEKITSASIDLATEDQRYRVRATFLKTLLVSSGDAADSSDKELLGKWAGDIPLVGKILKDKDPIGSLKPVVYDLIQPKERKDLHMREELVLLWSADPADESKIGNTSLLPPMPFPGQLTDVQYRGLKTQSDCLVPKVILQILYVEDSGHTALLAAWVIASKPSGEYEFYMAPVELLQRAVIEPDTNPLGGKVK